MKATEIINLVSNFYRKKLREIEKLKEELNNCNLERYEIEKNRKTTTLNDYKSLISHIDYLTIELAKQEAYAKGISSTREIILDLGFGIEIEFIDTEEN